MKIGDIDKNLRVNTEQFGKDLTYYDPEEAPFKIYGVFRSGEAFCRMPRPLAESISGSLAYLNENTAGGRVRFQTDSRRIVIDVILNDVCNLPHMATCGVSGFDMYEKTGGEFKYLKSFIPPADHGVHYTAEMQFKKKKRRDLVINFPLYCGVKKLHIGLYNDAEVCEGSKYAHKTPIVYYGSSITQGGCASKPGSSYQAILSSYLDADYINLGFSGNAKGEPSIAEYIANLPMSAFVYAYDHNAPGVDHLKKTHKPFFDIVRKQNPTLPIVILSRPAYYLNTEEKLREEIIQNTYRSAVDSGDENVYFFDGKKLMSLVRDNGTVDGVHPTDSGFFSIAKTLLPVMQYILSKE